jgi:hypothetical protein
MWLPFCFAVNYWKSLSLFIHSENTVTTDCEKKTESVHDFDQIANQTNLPYFTQTFQHLMPDDLHLKIWKIF